MDIESYPAGPPDEWDELCRQSPTGWFWHTRSWLDYTRAYSGSRLVQDLSFGVRSAGRLVALVPILLEDLEQPWGGRQRCLSFGGAGWWGPCVAAKVADTEAAEATRAVFENIEHLAVSHKAAYSSFRVSPLAPEYEHYGPIVTAEAIRAGWSDRSQGTLVLQLEPDLDELRKRISKGHRADINRAAKTVQVVAAGADQAGGGDIFDAYRAMHARAAGRVTRAGHTFDLMAAWIGAGHGALFGAQRDGAWLGFAYVLVFGAGAYYASAANDPTTREPIGHLLQWHAIEWLKARGVTRYELGQQPFGPLPHDIPSAKEIAIGRFKRGFGGRLVPLFERERWWSAEDYESAFRWRFERYQGARWASL